MTTPTAPAGGTTGTSKAGSAPVNSLALETVKALQVALDCEHAAVWAYGPISAFATDPGQLATLNAIRSGHLNRRDSTMGLLQASGVSPDAPAPSYQLPTVPKDLATARKAAYQIEEDCAKAWRAVVGMTDISALRGIAQQAMSDSAVWTTRIKMAAKDPKPTVTLPGTT